MWFESNNDRQDRVVKDDRGVRYGLQEDLRAPLSLCLVLVRGLHIDPLLVGPRPGFTGVPLITQAVADGSQVAYMSVARWFQTEGGKVPSRVQS